ncbi:MAG: SprB repeat-containing protein, partial [Bacteroidia bacterium]|nr:SprB repeat-containing protein [Bacteroidia bacterium]
MKTLTRLVLGYFLIISTVSAQTNLINNQPSPLVGGGRVLNTVPAVSQSASERDGDDILGQTYNQTQCGLNYVSSSQMITTRYTPPGAGLPAVFPISGIPACATIVKAYVWWIVSYQTGSSLTPSLSITNPNLINNSYVASLAGTSGPKCWAEIGTRTFRADVTSNINGNGNYTIDVIGNPVWEIDGITLIIIYSDPFATYQGTFVIYDGCLSYQSSTPATQDIQNFTACDNSVVARGFTITGDQQNNISPSHSCTINGTPSVFPNDFWNFDEASTSITTGQTTSTFGVTPASGDCWSWAAMGLYYQTANCTTCTPPSALSLAFQNTDATCGQNNGSATVTVTGGTPPYNYTWNTVPPQSTATASGLGAGTYTVIVTDGSGCNSATATVTINAIGGINLSTTSLNVLCHGDATGSASVSITSGGTPPFVYSWNTVPIQNTASASSLPAGTFTVTITDSSNCAATASVVITEPPALSITFSNFSHTTCGDSNGSIAPVYGGGTGQYSYLWSNAQSSSSVNNLPAGTYTVTVSDANQCSESASFTINASTPPQLIASGNVSICQGQSTTLSVAGTSTYTWSPPTALSATTGSTVDANPFVTITYQIIGQDVNGCVDTAYITVTVNPLPFVFTPPAPSICSGATVNVSISGADFYHWSPQTGLSNPNGPDSSSVDVTLVSTTTYTVTGFSFEGCSATASITVIVNPNPQPMIVALGDTSFCAGGSVILEPFVSNPGDTYSWNPNGELTPQINVTQSGTFTLTVTDVNGCVGTSPPVTVTVHANPIAVISPAGPVLICTNNPTTLSASVGPGYLYQWFLNGNPIVGATSDQYSTAVTGTYSVHIIDAFG